MQFQRAQALLVKRLPASYMRVRFLGYLTTLGMMKSEAVIRNVPLKQIKAEYNQALAKPNKKQKYIKTKYYGETNTNQTTQPWKEVCMLAGDDEIKISLEAIAQMPFHDVVFALLHEIGHMYYKKGNQLGTEHQADTFAIRWIKVFIKEGLIEDYVKN